ncbi:hypothetical protein Psta_4174 [Pirellula staleyi DSM 6068]|uniref:Uncharacterized protein n=1 Tax=Pirellula staleyi (strain ATCC 27377 / DSM 6068 / ICPB 4128) TaxID=530564 RepID=D2R3X4_PIRSD|nr:hypothetical protein Psta_4174 [Pirellula staleyi DSM 6068]
MRCETQSWNTQRFGERLDTLTMKLQPMLGENHRYFPQKTSLLGSTAVPTEVSTNW